METRRNPQFYLLQFVIILQETVMLESGLRILIHSVLGDNPFDLLHRWGGKTRNPEAKIEKSDGEGEGKGKEGEKKRWVWKKLRKWARTKKKEREKEKKM